MNILKLFTVGLSALAMASTAMAQSTFFDAGITLQGKTIDLGNAGRVYKWGALTTDGDFKASDGSMLEGNVGIWGTTNKSTKPGNLILSGAAQVQGDLYIRQGGTKSISGGAILTGSTFQNAATNSILSTAVSHVNLLSSNIASLTKTSNFSISGFKAGVTASNLSAIIGQGAGDNTASLNLTIDGSAATSPIVLKLTDFVLNDTNDTQLTLIGSATTKFIINVTNQFAITSSSDLLLSGGLLAGNVIFNYTGSNNILVDGGSTMSGILVAKNSAVTFTGGSEITGEVIGKSVTLSGGSKVKKPKPSP